jgi:predicted ATPase
MARRVQDATLLLEAHHTLWAILASLGELSAAQMHAQQGIVSYNKEQHRHLAFLYGGHDPGVCCRTHAARQLWLLGYPDQALRRSQEALALARELAHTFSLALSLLWEAWVYQQRGETQTAQDRTEALLAIATEHAFPRFLVQGTFLRACLLVEHGQMEKGIAQMRLAAAVPLVTSIGRERAYFFALMAEAFGRGGDSPEGLRTVTGELDRARKTGGHYYDAELHRIRGELLLSQTVATEKQAETCFREAIDVSRRQGAKSLELRAVMSLSRLWQKQGKKEEARQMLAEIYGWFTEGFDTADLRKARTLLEELS